MAASWGLVLVIGLLLLTPGSGRAADLLAQGLAALKAGQHPAM